MTIQVLIRTLAEEIATFPDLFASSAGGLVLIVRFNGTMTSNGRCSHCSNRVLSSRHMCLDELRAPHMLTVRTPKQLILTVRARAI